MEFTRRNFIKTAFIGGVGAMLPIPSWASSNKAAESTNPNYAILDMPFNLDFPFECKTSSLVPENGVVHINKQFYA